MKGGFNNPPNPRLPRAQRFVAIASMKGGFNNPPNPDSRPLGRRMGAGFNEGGV